MKTEVIPYQGAVKHELHYYNKYTVLRKGLGLYHRKRNYLNKVSILFALRFRYGTQFMLDMFVLSEMYITHHKTIDIVKLRSDVMNVMNSIIEYRIKHERT